jgi:DNA invertase Pin-like site-specific DNA recombinase
MRAAIYARYSTDLQREASIEDQVRICRQRIEQQGWQLTATYTDAATSGASRLRPGYQKLLEDARAGTFDVVVAEALDRLSRDQEDVAALFKRLSFVGVKLVTLAEDEINELHVGLKGTMNALFLKDLAQKIRRGLEGRVRAGFSGGGLGYGYDTVREFDAHGEPLRGRLVVNECKARVVRRIFEEYANGRSPRAIAAGLNADGIYAPSGKSWSPSTIYGNWRRGTGILNNELYVGRRVWNRQKFIKDPATGKRVTRYNSPERLVVQDAQALRIVPESLWRSVKERQKAARSAVLGGDGGVHSERARRPAYLLSGLLRCGVCGGGFSKRSETHYACSTAHNTGTCSNRLRIRRDVLEASVLGGLKTHLMQPELVREFIAEYHRELNRLRATVDLERLTQQAKLARTESEIRAVIDAIKSGIRSPTMQAELLMLEQRQQQLAAAVKDTQPHLVRLQPDLADLYRKKLEGLVGELNREAVRSEAAAILRGLIQEIRLVPENGQLEIELVGDLGAILNLASGSLSQVPTVVAKITVVAGEGLEPPTRGL